MAAEANVPTQGPGSVVFEEGNVLDGSPIPIIRSTSSSARRVAALRASAAAGPATAGTSRNATGPEAGRRPGHARCFGLALLPQEPGPRPVVGAKSKPGVSQGGTRLNAPGKEYARPDPQRRL